MRKGEVEDVNDFREVVRKGRRVLDISDGVG